MATGGQEENGCSLIKVEGVTIVEDRPILDLDTAFFTGIVVGRNMIFVLHSWLEVGVYGLQEGKLLHMLNTMGSVLLCGICLINDTEIAVILENGLIKKMSIDSPLNTRVIKWTRNLHEKGGLDKYHGVVSVKDDFVVCGTKQNMMCWCIVSSSDGPVVGTIYQICKVKNDPSSFMTTKDKIIYISCNIGVGGDSDDNHNGVYAYDVQNPSKYIYIYRHEDLKRPGGIVIDQHGYLFVCNRMVPDTCIHYITSECHPVSIFARGIPHDPMAIFWDNEHLYITWAGSNHITRYRTQYPGMYKNLGVQGEIEVSQTVNLKAPVDQSETVFIQKQLAELANSVGIIKTRCGSWTGFRVGPDYIMTARHVIEPIMMKGMYKNLGVQGEIEVAHKGNFKAVINEIETVFIHRLLVELAKSVGIIKTPCGSGTGFRVGPNYVMTARHVVEPIMMKVPLLQQQMQLLEQHQLSDTNVFIDFSYEWNSVPSDPNLVFYFEPEIVYESAYLDTVILKLKPATRMYPPHLTNFIDVTQLPQDRSHGYFIGHSGTDIKKTDRYQIVSLTASDIYYAKKWSMEFVNEDGYDGIDNQHRVLFHCSFERGASGAPGFWINPANGQAYVELMLVCGYPKWYYDKYARNVSGIPKNFFVEQGISMKSVYDDVKARDELLCNTIFGTR